jgi:tetratricopeptide (TPR) repeat protein
MIFALAAACSAGLARAENEGQEDLDQATEKKLSATTLDDLSQVIDLCDSALKKGLDQQNTQFANSLLTSSLLNRATAQYQRIVRQTPGGWPQLRKEALADLEKAIKIQPDLAPAQLLIAEFQILPGGDKAAAQKAAEEAVKLGKEDPAIQVAALVLQAKLVDDAGKMRQIFDDALKIAPRNDELLVYRGKLLLEEGKSDNALADFEAAVKSNPENADAQEARGLALAALGRGDEALDALAEATKLEPDAAGPYLHRARIHLQKQDGKKALDDLADALKLDTGNAAALALQARAHQLEGDTKAAEADVAEVLKSQGDVTPALRMLVSQGSGGLRQIVADMEELRQISPKNAELLSQLGMLYTMRKQPHKAISRYGDALAADPEFFTALRGRADSYLSVGKHAEAIEDYEKAVKIKPDDTGILNNFAWVLATSPEDSLRDAKRSIQLSEHAAKLTEYKQAHILSTLAAGYAESGDFDKAAEWSQKAVDAGKNDSETDQETNEQLKQELASYGQKKPWREKQETQDAEDPPKSAANPSAVKKE